MDKQDLAYLAAHLDFWPHLSSRELAVLEQHIIKKHYIKESNLHSVDQECLGVVLVKTGGLRAYILSEDGREVTLYRLIPGDVCILSAACALHSITFDVYIDAETDTDAYLIPISIFTQLMKENIYIENFSYKKTIDRFSDVMWAMEQILFMTFDKRLAIFLLDESAKNNSPQLTLTQEQIARYIGSAREVVSRMLKVFQQEGIIRQSRGNIEILDKQKLRAYTL